MANSQKPKTATVQVASAVPPVKMGYVLTFPGVDPLWFAAWDSAAASRLLNVMVMQYTKAFNRPPRGAALRFIAGYEPPAAAPVAA